MTFSGHVRFISAYIYRPQTKLCQEFCSQGRGWYPSMHCRWYPSMHCRWYPSMPCRSLGVVSQNTLQVSRPTSKGEVQGSGLGGGSPGQHPRERVSRSTLGGCPGPYLGGVSRPTPGVGGVCQHALRQTPLQQTATAAGGKHPSGMHSCSSCFFRVLSPRIPE